MSEAGRTLMLDVRGEEMGRPARVSQGSARAPDYGAEARDLEAELLHRLRGEVRFDIGSRALYATDLSIYRQVPIGVIVPADLDDVEAAVEACRRHGVPIFGRGCGTSLAGQCCNTAVVLDFSKFTNRVLSVDADAHTAWVEPGAICDELRHATEPHGLIFPPDPATHSYCTLGGMIGNNSCGAHSLMGGKTEENVEKLEVLTYEGLRLRVGATSEDELQRIISQGGRHGQIYSQLRALRDRYADEIRARFPKIPRRVSGYNLNQLLPENGFHVARALVGTESTCALTLRAKLRLLPNPAYRALLVLGYPGTVSGGEHVPTLLQLHPIALEAFHEHVLTNMERKGRPPEGAALLPAGRLWLLAEFGGATPDEAKERAQEAMADISRHGRAGALDLRLVDDPREQRMLWKLREAGVGASRVPGEEEAWPSWEDAAVAPERLGDYLRDFMALLKRHGYAFTIFGHFGQGCVHARITFKTRTAEGVRDYRRFLQEAADLVSAYGGSLSGEHGDGQARGELLPKMYGPALVRAFQEFKAIWDPLGKMNPGKVVSPYPLDTNLRIGPDYRPLPVLTRFRFPDDHGSMAEASRRCFGVGKCRALEGGTMCPSFRATREEMHTTRGRAHLLFEMLRGDALRDGFRDPAVKEALDLCLACKGCKGDCPVQVDMATYKAEFLSHYYEGRPRPIAAFVQGRIFRWARLASLAPGLANLLTQTRGLSAMMKAAAGMAPERPLPPFARQTFRSWFRARPERNAGMPRVILWPDTFNNYFYPQTARAAVEVLEAAGRQVVIPPQVLCCGRPLYDYGLLDEAKAKLAEILAALRPEIEAGVPVVGLEPSCVSVFRDELHGLLPDDEDARRLAGQTFLLSEFLAQAAREGRAVPRVPRRAIVHGHCHHKSLFGMDDEEAVLKHAGVDAQLLDSGCCGLAGGFGYERRHYDLSMKIGELALLPAVRAAPPEALIVADGFSCRSQIEHGTHRRALHLAEVLKLGLGGDKDKAAASGPYPERAFPSEAARPRAFGLLGVAVAGLCCVLGVRWLARR